MKYFLSILLFCSISVFASVPNHRHLVVNGQAQVSAVPDIAVISFSVESKMATALRAKNSVDNIVNAFLDGLNTFQINEKNVSASNISTEPSYKYSDDDNEELDGYIASRSIKVTLHEIKRLNEFLDFALGVKVSEIDNIEFQSSEKDKLKKEAIAFAVQDAKNKANAMAEAFDATLGKVYSIDSENRRQRSRNGYNDYVETITVTGSVITAGDFRPGKYLQENIVFSASVNVVFDIEVTD